MEIDLKKEAKKNPLMLSKQMTGLAVLSWRNRRVVYSPSKMSRDHANAMQVIHLNPSCTHSFFSNVVIPIKQKNDQGRKEFESVRILSLSYN